jgi:hypothetical protein
MLVWCELFAVMVCVYLVCLHAYVVVIYRR